MDDLSEQLLDIMKDLKADADSFEELGISYEEKAFYDILIKVRDDHEFEYSDENALKLAKDIKELVDDKAKFADWSSRDDIKNQLRRDLVILLHKMVTRHNGIMTYLNKSWNKLRISRNFLNNKTLRYSKPHI